jgi:hypothetical protein
VQCSARLGLWKMWALWDLTNKTHPGGWSTSRRVEAVERKWTRDPQPPLAGMCRVRGVRGIPSRRVEAVEPGSAWSPGQPGFRRRHSLHSPGWGLFPGPPDGLLRLQTGSVGPGADEGKPGFKLAGALRRRRRGALKKSAPSGGGA